MYELGHGGLAIDIKEATALYRKAAAQGDADATWVLRRIEHPEPAYDPEAAEALRKENERKAREERVAADRTSPAKHTTRYRGLYVGELIENAPMKQSGCKSYDANLETALENIGMGKSITECLVDFDYLGAIDKAVVFTRISYLQEYNELVGRYGASLPGRYAELSQDSSGCCNLWHTKDGTAIWERPAHLTMRGNPENAYRQTVVPYTIVVFESQ
jgi:hypothetical protein